MRDPEVHEPHVDGVSLDEHDVLRFDVPVHHTPLVSVLQGAAQLDARFENVQVGERLLAIVVAERLSLDVFGDKEGPVRLADHLVDREDVMMAQFGRGLGLAEHAVVNVGGLLHHLDGHRAPHLQIVGQIDGGECSAAQLADDLVAIVEKGCVGHCPSISLGCGDTSLLQRARCAHRDCCRKQVSPHSA